MATTIYYRMANGAVSERVVEGVEGPIAPPPGATEITAEEYQQGLAEWEAAREARRAEVQAAEAAEAKQAYEDLIAAGIPEATARRLSGYVGEADPA